MINLYLYQYHGAADALNKLEKSDAVMNLKIDSYYGISDEGLKFTLDTLYSANLIAYEFNNVMYYGWLNVSDTYDGLYEYSVTVDPAATYYYGKDTKNSIQHIIREPSPPVLMPDPNLPITPNITRREQRIQSYNQRSINYWYFAVTIVKPSPKRSWDFPVFGQYNNNPSFQTYLMSSDDYIEFIDAFYKFNSTEQAQLAPSVVKIFTIHTMDLSTLDIPDVARTNRITLHAVVSDSLLLQPGAQSKTIELKNKNVVLINDVSKPYTIDVDTPLDLPWRKTVETLNDRLLLHINATGDINIGWNDLSDWSVNSIGYRRHFDFVGGTQTAYLIVNGTVYKNLKVTAPLPLVTPFFMDSSIANWANVAASSAAALFSIGATAVSGGALAPLAIGAAGNAITQIAATEYSSMTGSSSTVGATGGSTDYFDTFGSYIIITHREVFDYVSLKKKYGAPSDRYTSIKNLKTAGRYLIEQAKLESKYIPRSIMAAAESILNSGFEILSKTAN